MQHFKIEEIEKQGGKPLQYRTGGFPHWLVSRLARFHNISYSNLKMFRISGTNDHWVIVSYGDIKPFTDEPLLP